MSLKSTIQLINQSIRKKTKSFEFNINSRYDVHWPVSCRIHRLYLYRKIRTHHHHHHHHSQQVFWIWNPTIWWWGSSSVALENTEYLFIAITPLLEIWGVWSTPSQSSLQGWMHFPYMFCMTNCLCFFFSIRDESFKPKLWS